MKASKPYVDYCRRIRGKAKELLMNNRRATRSKPWHHTCRSIEFMACDANGERIDEVIYEDRAGLSGVKVREAIRAAVESYDECRRVSVAVGIDTYDSLNDMLRGGDYEPGTDWWDEEVPAELVEPFLTTDEGAIKCNS